MEVLETMQALIEMVVAFIAFLAAAALSQLGVNLDLPRPADREVHRVMDCREQPAPSALISDDKKTC